MVRRMTESEQETLREAIKVLNKFNRAKVTLSVREIIEYALAEELQQDCRIDCPSVWLAATDNIP